MRYAVTAEHFLALLEDTGMSTQALAVRLGVHANNIERWRKKGVPKKRDTLIELAQVFHELNVGAKKLEARGFSEEILRAAGIEVPPGPGRPAITTDWLASRHCMVHPAFARVAEDKPPSGPTRSRDGRGFSLTILCDFDGTMTKHDTTDEILDKCADEMWRSIEEAWDDHRKLWTRECMLFQSMCIPVSDSVINDMNECLKKVELDPGFRTFVERCRDLNVELIVNSDGFDRAVKKVLQKEGIDGLEVYSNELKELGQTHTLSFPNGHPNCWDTHSNDTQGTCKCMLASRAVAEHRGVVLIGNDRTDCCAVRYAAKVYACKKRKPPRGARTT